MLLRPRSMSASGNVTATRCGVHQGERSRKEGGAVSARLVWPPGVVCVLAGLDVGCRVLDRLDCSALGG